MGDEERKTQDTPSRDQRDASGKICEYCGAMIDTSDWYPVTKERDSDESLQIYSFCSEDCQEAWSEERLE